MPDASQNGKLEVASGKFWNCVGDYKAIARSKKLKICDSLFLFFTAGKKEGGPTINKFKIKG